MAIAALILALLGLLAIVVFFYLYCVAVLNIDDRLIFLEDALDRTKTPDA